MSAAVLDPPDLRTDEEPDDAPWGVNPRTGKPYTRSPEQRAAAAAAMTAGRQNKARGGSAPPRTRKSAAKSPTYTETAHGIINMAAFGAGMLGRFIPVMAYHSVALGYHSQPLAEAIGAAAMDSERLGAWLTRVGTVSSGGAVLMALLPLVLQGLANHGMIPPNPEMGIFSPEDLLREAGVSVPSQDPDVA